MDGIREILEQLYNTLVLQRAIIKSLNDRMEAQDRKLTHVLIVLSSIVDEVKKIVSELSTICDHLTDGIMD